jgi:hypothetical protein
MTCRISRFQDGGSLNNYITIFFSGRNFKSAYISSFQTSVYTLGEFHKNRNNSTVFEELSVSIVDLTVPNAVLLVTRSGASKTAFATVKSTIDTDNSSNTVLLFLN